MNDLHSEPIVQWFIAHGSDFATKSLAAIIVWFIGRRLIKFSVRLLDRKVIRDKKMEPTFARYVLSMVNVALTALLIVGILDMFGVQTTSLAALLAGTGIALGIAWGGMLGHFAAGMIMQVAGPFKVGDYVALAGVEGTVTELGLFGTTIVSIDNVVHIVGNNKVFSDIIKNYSALPFRRVECEARVALGPNMHETMARIGIALCNVNNVMPEPRPDVQISKFTVEGPMIVARACTHNDHYWQVYFDISRIVERELGRAVYPLVPLVPVVPAAPEVPLAAGA
jgi:small conductance mechanosensitive channel